MAGGLLLEGFVTYREGLESIYAISMCRNIGLYISAVYIISKVSELFEPMISNRVFGKYKELKRIEKYRREEGRETIEKWRLKIDVDSKRWNNRIRFDHDLSPPAFFEILMMSHIFSLGRNRDLTNTTYVVKYRYV